MTNAYDVCIWCELEKKYEIKLDEHNCIFFHNMSKQRNPSETYTFR